MATKPTIGTSYAVSLGPSFAGTPTHRTLRYSFKPTSVKWGQRGRLTVNGESAAVQYPASTPAGTVIIKLWGATKT